MHKQLRVAMAAGVLALGLVGVSQSAMAAGPNSIPPGGGGPCTAIPKFTEKDTAGDIAAGTIRFAVTNNSCGDQARERTQYKGTILSSYTNDYSTTVTGNGTIYGDLAPSNSVDITYTCQYNDGNGWHNKSSCS